MKKIFFNQIMFAYLKVIITDDNVGAHLYKRITFLFSAFFCVLLKYFFSANKCYIA